MAELSIDCISPVKVDILILTISQRMNYNATTYIIMLWYCQLDKHLLTSKFAPFILSSTFVPVPLSSVCCPVKPNFGHISSLPAPK